MTDANFIDRTVADLREGAAVLPADGRLSLLLTQGADLIIRLREANAATRAEHERAVTQLLARIAELEREAEEEAEARASLESQLEELDEAPRG